METKKRITRILVILMAIMLISGIATPSDVSAATRRPYKVTVTSIKSVDHNAIMLKWKKAKYAKKYQVYRATSKNGKYKRVATTKKLSYTNSGLTTGKKYYYKVRAVNGSRYGKYSYKKVATPKLKTPSLTNVTTTDFTIKVTIGKVSGAKGYIIYRATSAKGDYVRIGSTTKATYTSKNLTPDRAYYYKVKAYKWGNGKTQYSSYSRYRKAVTKAHVHEWIEKSDTTEKITYVCSGCKEEQYHDHAWVARYDEKQEVAGYDCNCGRSRTHTHDWNKVENEYRCECGAKRDENHGHEFVAVYEDVDHGSVQSYRKDVELTFCNKCEGYIDTPLREHFKKEHPDQGTSGFYRYVTKTFKKWVPDVKNELVGYRCSICKKEQEHIHAWTPVYEDGYYGKEPKEVEWSRCNGCGADVSDDDFRQQHILEHDAKGEGLPGWTYHYKMVDVDVWVDEQIQTGYSCLCGASR